METKYIAYYRVSTQKQGESRNGLENQQAEIRKFAGVNLIGEFIEVESGKKVNRPQLEKAMATAKENNAVLLAFSLDRLLRSLEILVMLRGANISFTALDCLNDSKMIIDIKASFAEEELRKVSERTKNGLKAVKTREGKTHYKVGTKNNITPDVRKKALETRQNKANERSKKVAYFIANEIKNGKNFTEILNLANELGYTTPRGLQFKDTNQIKRFLIKQ